MSIVNSVLSFSDKFTLLELIRDHNFISGKMTEDCQKFIGESRIKLCNEHRQLIRFSIDYRFSDEIQSFSIFTQLLARLKTNLVNSTDWFWNFKG